MTNSAPRNRLVRRVERKRDERGVVLVLFALTLVVLLIFAAIMVDLGSWYKQSQDLQRTVDAAALAGSTYLPGSPGVENQSGAAAMATCGANPATAIPTNAYCAALKIVMKNGYDGTGLSAAPDATNTNQFDVNLVQKNVQTYFASSFTGALTFTRTSHALFSQPIPLGSPQNYFGTGDLAGFPGANGNATSGFWAAIDGACSPAEQGDQYATAYDGSFDKGPPGGGAPNLYYLPPGGCGDQNNRVNNPNTWDPNGYVYDISVPPGQTSTLWLYDPYFNPCYQQVAGTLKRMDTDLNFALYNTSVATCEVDNGNGISKGPGDPAYDGMNETKLTTYFNLFSPAAPPVQQSFSYNTKRSNTAPSWVRVADLTTSGTWQLNVSTLPYGSTLTGSDSYGQNSFAIFASEGTNHTTPGTVGDAACSSISDVNCPEVYADQASGLSVKMISGAATTDDIYLAQVPSFSVGKTVDVTLWDPGDLASYIQILDSHGNPVPSFKYTISNANNVANGSTTTTTCNDPVPTGNAAQEAVAPHPFVGASGAYACLPVDQCIQGTSSGSPLGNCLDTNGYFLSGAPNNRFGPAVYSDAQVDLYFTVTAGMLGANGNWFSLREVVPSGQSVNDRLTMGLHVLGLPPHLTP